jgi:hypothetical protein
LTRKINPVFLPFRRRRVLKALSTIYPRLEGVMALLPQGLRLQRKAPQSIEMSSCKEVGMRSCSFEHNLILLQFVNEKPIRFDVALPTPGIVTNEFMISMKWIQNFALNECADNDFNLLHALPARPHSLDIPLELAGIDWNPH